MPTASWFLIAAMVGKVRFRPTTTIAESMNDGGGNAFSPYCHHHQEHKRWWWKCVFTKSPPLPRAKRWWRKRVFAKSPPSPRAKRWWRKCVFDLLPLSPGAEAMVVEMRFRLTATITRCRNDGGGNAFSLNHHHFPRNERLCV